MNRSVSVVGIGRVGLPLALHLARNGFQVYGIDKSKSLVETLRQGRMPFLEEQGEAFLRCTLGKTFFPTAEPSCIAETDDIIITLGTPIDENFNPIFTLLEQAMASLLPFLRANHLLVLRSTVAPGTTVRLGRYLDRNSSLQTGRDIYLAFCPERIAEGKSLLEIPEIPQIIGGLDSQSTQRAAELFRSVTTRVLLTDATSAELAKLFCNMYRYIDFAIGNEFMDIALQHNRNIFEILDLVNRDYKRAGLKPPGLTGGPCLYKDGFFLVARYPVNDLISAAWKINEGVPTILVDELQKHISLKGTKTALLGLTFKKNIDDDRHSLSHEVYQLLKNKGSEVRLHDPFLRKGDLGKLLPDVDVIMICTNHDFYRKLGLDGLRKLARPDTLVCDIWNSFGTGRLVYSLREVG